MAADQSKLRLALVRLLSCGFRSQRILERESEEKNWYFSVTCMIMLFVFGVLLPLSQQLLQYLRIGGSRLPFNLIKRNFV
ncbi:hypothetical protein HanXRQr2_Chr11g0520791 [Helianthus annuus]|uniref:Uncharacterized protein n=1 Tax=Helianthus annuus TaxID=4232 RepID=A0A9K3HUI2_HELAN|nr:hypothetical protein HanXRQr2_Chr11g0520791 [Helianthus annuus]